MKKDNILDGLIALLKENKKEHTLEDLEIEKLAMIIYVVIKSSPDIRVFFYAGVEQIAYTVKDILKAQEKEIHRKLAKIKKDDDDSGNNILN